MGDALNVAIAALVAFLAYHGVQRFVRRNGAEPGDYAGSPVRLKPRPKRDAGAVALIEPDEEA